jgi:hypothetical protein
MVERDEVKEGRSCSGGDSHEQDLRSGEGQLSVYSFIKGGQCLKLPVGNLPHFAGWLTEYFQSLSRGKFDKSLEYQRNPEADAKERA